MVTKSSPFEIKYEYADQLLTITISGNIANNPEAARNAHFLHEWISSQGSYGPKVVFLLDIRGAYLQGFAILWKMNDLIKKGTQHQYRILCGVAYRQVISEIFASRQNVSVYAKAKLAKAKPKR